MIEREDKLWEDAKKNGTPYFSSSPEQFIQYCLTNYFAKLESYGPMGSIDGADYFQSISSVRLRFLEDGRFEISELNFSVPNQTDYIYRGHCEFLK